MTRSKTALTDDGESGAMVTTLGLLLGAVLTLIVVLVHYAPGTEWRSSEDISTEVLQQRATTVPETDFPEPMNRSIGGGGAAVSGSESGGAELEEGEVAEESEGPWSLSDEEADTYEIDFEKEGETVAVAENQTLLEAGEDQGWDLPYACREGQCLSCSAHIEDGPAEDFVIHHDQEMLGDSELEDGYTLTCVAHPQSEFTIETRESP